MFSSNALDWALIVLYFGFLAAVWLRLLGRRASPDDYLVAGRRVTLPAFVATLVATWYGGILGVGEYSWRYGISNWLVFGVPYYIGALLFAFFFAKRAREEALYTLPDLLERHYGRGPALMGALSIFVVSAPAAYVLMLGTLFASMFHLPLVPCVIAASLFSVFYIYNGGLRSVVLTDQVQFVLMYVGFILMFIFLVARHGFLGFLIAHVPATHFSATGGLPVSAVIVWYFIALSTLVDPGFWQRAYAARDPQVAKRGVLISIAFWILFDFLTTFAGLYARAILPALKQPVFAFPELARVTLPPFVLGLFYLAMIATVMSTIDSYGFIAATTLGRDVMWRLSKARDDKQLTRNSQIGLWIAAAFATGLAITEQSVIDLWHDLGSITTPTLLVPVATAMLRRGRLGTRMTLAAMMIPFAISLLCVIERRAAPDHAAHGISSIEPIYAGLGASLLTYVIGWSLQRRATTS
jgi:solute:Na+ symporter, SSS family